MEITCKLQSSRIYALKLLRLPSRETLQRPFRRHGGQHLIYLEYDLYSTGHKTTRLPMCSSILKQLDSSTYVGQSVPAKRPMRNKSVSERIHHLPFQGSTKYTSEWDCKIKHYRFHHGTLKTLEESEEIH